MGVKLKNAIFLVNICLANRTNVATYPGYLPPFCWFLRRLQRNGWFSFALFGPTIPGQASTIT